MPSRPCAFRRSPFAARREAARTRGVGAVYFEHLNRVRELLAPYNRKLIFWGDIALNHPDLIGNIPKDLIVANWDYTPRESFATRIDPFKNAGLQQLVCPGVWGWNQIFPNVDVSSKNIINFVRDGQAAGAIGMLNTTWDDDGETLFEHGWYGIVLGAAASGPPAPRLMARSIVSFGIFCAFASLTALTIVSAPRMRMNSSSG